jgi:hypothetical protein
LVLATAVDVYFGVDIAEEAGLGEYELAGVLVEVRTAGSVPILPGTVG